MAHEVVLTESQLRHVDEWNSSITFEDLTFEGQARHVDEYRHAKRHEEEESS